MRQTSILNRIPHNDPQFQDMSKLLTDVSNFRKFLANNLQTQFETNTPWTCPVACYYHQELGDNTLGFNSDCTMPTPEALVWAIPFGKAVDAFHPTRITGEQALAILDKITQKQG